MIKELITKSVASVYSMYAVTLFAFLTASTLKKTTSLTAAGLLVGAGFFLPVRFFYRNYSDLYQEAIRKIKDEKEVLSLTFSLLVLSYWNFTTGTVFPGSEALNLSFRASFQIFFPLQNQLNSIIGYSLGPLVLSSARWLLQSMYIYLIVSLLVQILSSMADIGSEAFSSRRVR